MESSTFPSPSRNFYSRPCGRGDLEQEGVTMEMKIISTHAPAGGATSLACSWSMSIILFLLTPLREGRLYLPFPCRRCFAAFLLTPLREGRLYLPFPCRRCFAAFLLTPLREGRQIIRKYFGLPEQFLLTPLREGRLDGLCDLAYVPSISTHAPAGGATSASSRSVMRRGFLLTPLREGRQTHTPHTATSGNFYSRPCGRGDARDDAQREAHAHFYSRPCGRGDRRARSGCSRGATFLLTPLREGRQQFSTSPS